jgi:hypothetical protein
MKVCGQMNERTRQAYMAGPVRTPGVTDRRTATSHSQTEAVTLAPTTRAKAVPR